MPSRKRVSLWGLSSPRWRSSGITDLFCLGLLFGFGMVLSGGCVSGSLYRMAEGYVASWVSVGGILIGLGFLSQTWNWWWQATISQEANLWIPSMLNMGYGGGVALTLGGLLGVFLLFLWWESRSGLSIPDMPTEKESDETFEQKLSILWRSIFVRGWSAVVGGGVLGVIGVLMYMVHMPLGVTGELARFSNTVMCGKSSMFWKVRAIPNSATRSGRWPMMDRPFHRMSPSWGRYTWLMELKIDVLPAPLGPMIEKTSPFVTWNETFDSARTPPKRWLSSPASCAAWTGTNPRNPRGSVRFVPGTGRRISDRRADTCRVRAARNRRDLPPRAGGGLAAKTGGCYSLSVIPICLVGN